jgi:voltage-gated potassium channel
VVVIAPSLFIGASVISYNSRSSPLGQGRALKALGILVTILLIGTIGYRCLEGWDFLDSLYMTVISITTVGYREVGEVSDAGRIFTIFIIFSGIGIIAYILGMTAQAMVEFQVRSIIGRRKLGLKMKSIKNHYILCGFGRIGKIIAREMKLNKIPMVVIDNTPEERELLETEEIPFIIGDATVEEVLLEAKIEEAKGLVSVVASDADNLFITMSARGLNPKLFILARSDQEHTEKKLLRAGANKVVSPYLLGGHKMAQSIIKPAVTDFIEFTVHNRKIGLGIEELRVSEESRLNGVSLIDSGIRQDMDVIIVAIRKKEGEMKFNPSSESAIEAEDTLIALGKRDDLEKLAAILSGE